MKALMKQQWLTNRISLLIWAAILALLGVTIVATYPGESNSMEFVKMLKSLPESISAMLGDAAFSGTISGWLQMNLYSIFPLVLSFYTVIFICGIISRELDTRSIEFTLSLPLERWKLICARFLVFVICSSLLVAIVFGALVITFIAYGHEVNILEHMLVFINALAVNIAIGGIVLLLSLLFTDYNRALTVGIGFILTSYLLSIIIQSTGTDNFIKYLSVFYYMDSNSILVDGRIDIKNILIPSLATIGFMGVSNIIFNKKELYL